MSNSMKKDKELLYLVIYLLIAFSGWFITPPEPITVAGMRLITVFFAAIFGWIVTSGVWVAVVTMILLPFTGMTTLTGMLGTGLGADIVLFTILLFAFVAFMEEIGVTNYVAAFMLTRKSLLGHPWRLMFVLFFVSWLLSTFCGNTAGMFITWAFIYKIVTILGYKPFEKVPNLLIFGVAVMGALSLSSVPWGKNSVVILAAYTASSGQIINNAHYLLYSVPVCIFSILAFLLMCKVLFRMDVSRLKEFNPNVFSSEDLELTFVRKVTLIAFGLLIVWFIVPDLLPAGNIIRVISAQMGLSLKMAVLIVFVSFLRVDGKPVFNFAKYAKQGVPWNVLMMILVILNFVGLVGNANAGISAWIAQTFTPMFAHIPPALFLFIVLALTVLLTNFMVNVVVATLMITAAVPIAQGLMIDPLQIVYMVTLGCTIAFMLPSASPASLLLFSNTDWIRSKDVYQYALPTIIVFTLITFAWAVVVFAF